MVDAMTHALGRYMQCWRPLVTQCSMIESICNVCDQSEPGQPLLQAFPFPIKFQVSIRAKPELPSAYAVTTQMPHLILLYHSVIT